MEQEYVLQMKAEEIDKTLQDAKTFLEGEVTSISITEDANGNYTIVNTLTNGTETIQLNVDPDTKKPIEIIINNKKINIEWGTV